MSNKQLARLVGALVVVLILWGGFALARRTRRDQADGLTLPKLDTAAVDTIAFMQHGDSAVLVRHGSAGWRVNGSPASSSNVDELLRALDDTSNWSELAAEQPGSQAAMGVTADSGRQVRVEVQGGAGLRLITGHSTSDYSGMYVRPMGGNAVYALHGPLAGALNRELGDWRDKTIASIPPDSVQRVEVTRGRHAYALVRAGKTWKLATGALADSAGVARLLAEFHPATAMGFAQPPVADSANFVRPTARVRLFGAGTLPLADLRFDSTATNLLVRADTGSTVYLMENWDLKQLAPDEQTLKASTPKVR